MHWISCLTTIISKASSDTNCKRFLQSLRGQFPLRRLLVPSSCRKSHQNFLKSNTRNDCNLKRLCRITVLEKPIEYSGSRPSGDWSASAFKTSKARSSGLEASIITNRCMKASRSQPHAQRSWLPTLSGNQRKHCHQTILESPQRAALPRGSCAQFWQAQ